MGTATMPSVTPIKEADFLFFDLREPGAWEELEQLLTRDESDSGEGHLCLKAS